MENFFHSIFGDALAEDRRLAIFTLPNKTIRHFTSIAAAVLWAGEQAHAQDVYFGLGLAGRNFERKTSAPDVTAIPGVWIDADVLSPHRNGKPLPENREEARDLLKTLPFRWSMLVDSGYGLHAHWTFKEPWILNSDEERARASRTIRGWHGLYCEEAAKRGWKADNLGYLSCILRPAGTWNRKGDKPVQVRVLEDHPDRRYNPWDFEPFEALESPTEVVAGEGSILRPDAEPPSEKMASLLITSPAFKATWERNRPDLPDQSQSAHDQALANIAALNGWTVQEIADLLIAFRRKHGQTPEKALRKDYIARTVGKAIAEAQKSAVEGVNLSAFHSKVLGTSNENGATGPRSLRELVKDFPHLRDPVIDGLLRHGESMNLIAASKIGKSWLVKDLALSIAAGRPWLGMNCVPGQVLIVDNELHPETIAHRIPKVAEAKGIDFEAVADRVHVEPLRGHLKDIIALREYFKSLVPGRFQLIIIDAWYRVLPPKTDENDNGAIAMLYNVLDQYADFLKTSFVLVHHTSKGTQSVKEITDVGAGAGAQSRAADAHVVLRHHKEHHVVALDAAVRSWPPFTSRCLRWEFPLWVPADELDPAMLRPDPNHKGGKADVKIAKLFMPEWTPSSFADAFVTDQPKFKDTILADATTRGLNDYSAEKLLKKAEGMNLIFSWTMDRNRVGYSKKAPPNTAANPAAQRSKTDSVLDLLKAEPGLTTAEVSRRCGVSDSYVRRIRRDHGEKHDGK